MLSELYIRDFAIIDELRMQFDFGFNVLTGETGAGKSIILDSLSLILGGRADSSMVRAECDRAIIEAAFELTPRAQDALRRCWGSKDWRRRRRRTSCCWRENCAPTGAAFAA